MYASRSRTRPAEVSCAADAWLDRAIPNQPVTMVFEYVVNAESTRNRFRLQLIDIHNDIPVQMSAEALKQEKARQATTGVDAKRHGRVRVPVRNMMIAPDDTTVCLQGAIIEETSKFRDWRREHGDSLPDCWHEVMVVSSFSLVSSNKAHASVEFVE